MHIFLLVLLILSLLATLFVMIAGVFGMSRGNHFSQKYSNKLMRWRVGLQMLSIIILIIYLAYP
ncbi:MAG: twin transmembrane helix small protein [Alphaproteobacteria bacterium]|jgi:hypothetical protein|nr:twin transmembrane helix small protein [Alphaproteobacteria bacterium]